MSGIASKAATLADRLGKNTNPAVVEMNRKLKKYAEAEKGIVASVGTMRQKASGLVVYGLNLKAWASKNKGPDAEAFQKRAKAFDSAIGGFESFTDSIDALLEGGQPGKARLPGNSFQKVLDDLEFKEKAPIANLRKAALDYYPAESAGQKKLREWSVHLNQLCTSLNTGLAELDPAQEQAELNYGRNEVLRSALELKKRVDAVGV